MAVKVLNLFEGNLFKFIHHCFHKKRSSQDASFVYNLLLFKQIDKEMVIHSELAKMRATTVNFGKS